MALALIVDLLLCNILVKPIVARIRPYDLNTAIHLLVSAPHDYSFPSGHTAVSFAAVTGLWRSRSRLWRWALILSVIIAFSRLYLYVHYPTDILGGVAFGVAAGFIGAAIAKKLNRTLRRFSFWG